MISTLEAYSYEKNYNNRDPALYTNQLLPQHCKRELQRQRGDLRSRDERQKNRRSNRPVLSILSTTSREK